MNDIDVLDDIRREIEINESIAEQKADELHQREIKANGQGIFFINIEGGSKNEPAACLRANQVRHRNITETTAAV